MHMSIPAGRWCVTRRDLKFFQQEVWRAVKGNKIQQPRDGRDDFDSHDHMYGPSIYTVNEQYIRPVTREAGMMSWALMRNPNGLDCDLFISHAWQEGVFEFLRKVRHSWPRGVRNAWCCMLANPQNLDIGAMLETPSESPFAVALRASQIVLVIPNRHQSVYTRLWCGYEAYLAQEEGKTILIAVYSHLPEIQRALWRMTGAALAGCVLGILCDFGKIRWPKRFGVSIAAAAFLGLCIENHSMRIVLNTSCEVLCFVEVTRLEVIFPFTHQTKMPWWVWRISHSIFWLMCAIFFCLSEVDRISGKNTVKEAQELRKGYQGSIRYADCARRSDASKIHQEIDEQIEEVDYAIDVLLTAGMSSPALRSITRQGVDIEFAAYSEITAAVVLLIPFEVLSVAHFAIHLKQWNVWYLLILHSFPIVGRLILLLLLRRSTLDERCFLLKVLTKFAAVLLVLLAIATILALFAPGSSPAMVWLCTSNAALLLVIPIAFLGIQGTAALPFGLCLLQLFFARGSKTLSACQCDFSRLCFSQKPLLPDSSSDSLSD